jgi:hypothetical protein
MARRGRPARPPGRNLASIPLGWCPTVGLRPTHRTAAEHGRGGGPPSVPRLPEGGRDGSNRAPTEQKKRQVAPSHTAAADAAPARPEPVNRPRPPLCVPKGSSGGSGREEGERLIPSTPESSVALYVTHDIIICREWHEEPARDIRRTRGQSGTLHYRSGAHVEIIHIDSRESV